MGTIMEPIPAEKMSTEETLPKSSIPSSFDSRQQWPNCVTPIRNQGQCGSCWAFGAAESFSDRLCIASGGQTSIVLSPEQLVSCDWEGNMGCNGGIPHLAWDYFEAFGIVSDSCFPYSAGTGSAPKCAKTCADGQPWTTHKTKLFSTKGYSGVEAIQTAIMTSGPVEGTISVYKDFMSYTSGVYEHTTGDYLGGHAIRMVGWGTENGTDYWLVANSWGTTWGEEGFFKIRRGTNECGIDSGAVAGTPKV
mmetsp:Transcript_21486/g.55816  ORF Transcript_21486/g.55816 Transcript_21486/m.55816 type:complete len:249 (-) Transcript_21486:64-810(-)